MKEKMRDAAIRVSNNIKELQRSARLAHELGAHGDETLFNKHIDQQREILAKYHEYFNLDEWQSIYC